MIGVSVPVGSIVSFEAADRNEEGVTRTIPGIVMKQWPDGSLQLFAFHFEGSFLVHAAPLNSITLLVEAQPRRLGKPIDVDKYDLLPMLPTRQ